MKKVTLLFSLIVFAAYGLNAQKISYPDTWGKQGFNLIQSDLKSVQVIHSIQRFDFENVTVNGQIMKNVSLQGSFLFNDAGMPNLPGKGKTIAIPSGSQPKLTIVSQRTETIHNVEIAPAPKIPLDNQPDFPLAKNTAVYSKNAFYPASAVQMSPVTQMRGVDVVTLGITPFQYNPVTKDLIVYRDLKIEISFEGGNGQFGDVAYRSYWWDPILQDNIINFSSLPAVDYNKRLQSYPRSILDTECEYIILTPTGPDYLAWADSVRDFRTQQGIISKVYTVDEVGGNTEAAIEGFIDNAYDTWTIKPVACLILGDYGTDGTKNIISHKFTHPDGYPAFASDNKYADVNEDEMPEIVFSRITANNASQLQTMVTKFLEYERNPPVDPLYYDRPITALGWQTVRWFQLCSEIVGGFFRNVYDKHPRRINAIYEGTPGSIWSSATNTALITNYFGPTGLAYIPSQPSEMGGWSGGNATMINNAVDSGAFMLMHRDHGNYSAWGEPAYNTGNINALNNTALTFVFSINCETGAYHNNGEVFGEKFHRHTKNGHNAGALGVVCPSETSYSFVNDTFVWGMMDNMWPNFMPDEGSTPESRGVLPAFGNAAGKYFLKDSNWPYNSGSKQVTYRLFHMFGDAFQVMYFQVPQQLTVIHDPTIEYGSTTFTIQANDSALIALTVDNEIIAMALGSASGPVVIPIPLLPVGSQVLVTVTKQNYFRYNSLVPVTTNQLVANFAANVTNICIGSGVNFTDMSSGSPETWQWEFQGGSPSNSDVQNPIGILYNTAGDYNVALTIQKSGLDPNSTTKTAYIHVFNLPTAGFTATPGCPGQQTQFTDQSDPNGGSITAWKWYFGDPGSGGNDSSSVQNPVHVYTNPGTYNVTLTITANGICMDEFAQTVTIISLPGVAATPTGNIAPCQNAQNIDYTTSGAENATSYHWEIAPFDAGTITGNTTSAQVTLAKDYLNPYSVKVEGLNDCGEGGYSEELSVTITPLPSVPTKPAGVDSIDVNKVLETNFITTETPNVTSYGWSLEPPQSGTISTVDLLTAKAVWNKDYKGNAIITVKGISTCGESAASEEKIVTLYSTLGIEEQNGMGISIFPNPTSGKLNVSVTANTNLSITVRIYNVIGNIVFEEHDVRISGKLQKSLDLSSLSKGLYHLKIEGEGVSMVKSFVIQK